MTWITRPRSEIAGLSAIVAGAGHHALMIHGVGLQADAWGSQIAAMTPAFHITAVDMPGHGQSARLAPQATLADFSDAIAACLEGPTVVIGHSLGAMIALDIAARYPDQVAGVAALNAIYRRDSAARAAVLARVADLDGRTAADPSAPLDRWFGPAPSPERDACHNWLTSVNPAGYKAAYQVFAHEDGPADAALAALHCPALFITGADEPNSTPAMSNQMARLSRGQAHVVAGAAHMLPMTHPTETNRCLMRFAKNCFA